MSKIYDFIKNCKVFYLASIEDNKPRVRPFGAIMEYNGELYFSTANTKKVYSQLFNNSAIQIVALKDGTRDWIRIDGKAMEVNDLSIKQVMLNTCPVLLKRFNANTCPYFALFKITEMQASLNTEDGVIIL